MAPSLRSEFDKEVPFNFIFFINKINLYSALTKSQELSHSFCLYNTYNVLGDRNINRKKKYYNGGKAYGAMGEACSILLLRL